MTELTTNAPPSTLGEASQEWDEAQIRASLARLEHLQDQFDDLRSTIPSIIAVATNLGTSKTTYFKQVRGAVARGTEELKTFTNDWQDKRTQDIFSRSRARREEDGDMKLAVGVAKYGWTEDKQGGEGTDSGKPEDAKKTVESWREKHKSLDAELEEDNGMIDMQYAAGPLKLHFTLKSVSDGGDDDNDGKQTYKVSCPGSKPIFAAIERCVASRPRPSHLYDTLEMLASYSSLMAAPCVACNRLLDRHGTLPAARRQKPSARSPGDSNAESKWEAMHENCLPR